MDVRVIFEDDWLVAIDKPSGLATHAGAGLRDGTVTDWIRQHLGARATRNGFAASPAHRLDRETSGVLLVAKRRPAMVALMDAFSRGGVRKRYVALVGGALDADAGVIDAPLPDLREGRRGVQAARTAWRVERRSAEATLVRCEPATGRTHQIRRHFREIGHPLAGDARYGDAAFNALASRWGLARLFLHAGSIAFAHPKDARPITLESPLPAELAAVVARAMP